MAADRRAAGTGSLLVRTDTAGRETWYGKWTVDGRQVKRRIGPRSGRNALSRQKANAELVRLMAETPARARDAGRTTVGAAGEALIDQLEANGRKPSTVESYRSTLKTHLVPFFKDRPLDRVTAEDVERLIRDLHKAKKQPKTILNALGLLHSIFVWAERKRLVPSNPCKLVDKPRPQETSDLRYLTLEELDALYRAVPDDENGRVERVLYLTAAMTGMRQGELLGLRWGDIDWTGRGVRVRQAFVRGEFSTPKSRRGSRRVPMADRVAGELERLFQASAWQADDALVFCHPATGQPFDRSNLLKRYKLALVAAKVRDVRFHDLRHTFGTMMAGAGVPMRTLQEWMGHRDLKTTLIYADYAPTHREAEWVEQAFARTQVGDGQASPVH